MLLEAHGSFALDFLRVRSSHIDPRPSDYVGNFYSSSGLLNRIWYAGAYTLDLDTAHSRGGMVVIDGAKRDRLVWLGDLEMEALVGSYTVRQMPAAIERSLAMFSCQQWPSGYIPMASDLDISCPHGPGLPDGPPTAALDPRRLGWPQKGRCPPTPRPGWRPSAIATCSPAIRDVSARCCRRWRWRSNTCARTSALTASFRGGSFGWDAFDQLQEADTFSNRPLGSRRCTSWQASRPVWAKLGPAAADEATAEEIAAAVRGEAL